MYENFTNNKTQYNLQKDIISRSSKRLLASITDPIEKKYLPTYIQKEDDPRDIKYDIIIIDIYRKVLDRHPSKDEVLYYKDKFKDNEMSEDYLKTILYNMPEFYNKSMLQSDDVRFTLEYSIYREKLMLLISDLYSEYLKKDVDKDMLPYLINVYIHLRFEPYLFGAFLQDKGYPGYVRDIKNADIITNTLEYQIFYDNINMNNVKKIADTLKLEESKLSVNTIMKYITLNDTTSKVIIMRSKNTSNISNTSNDSEHPENLFKDMFNPLGNINNRVDTDIAKLGDKDKCRIYHPMRYKPPVCTNLGKDTLTQPVFIESSALFHGTDLKDAENTGIGWIMPKFEYREYIETECK